MPDPRSIVQIRGAAMRIREDQKEYPMVTPLR